MAKQPIKERDVAQIEKVLGRKLSPTEIANGKLEKQTQPQTAEQLRDAKLQEIERQNWKPVVVAENAIATLHAQLLAARRSADGDKILALTKQFNDEIKRQSLAIAEQEAAEQLFAAAFAKMTPEEKRAALVARDKKVFEDGLATEKAKTDFLASVKPQADRLAALREQLDADPACDETDLFVIDKALIQLQTVGGCKETTAKLIAEADALVASKRTAKGNQIAKRLAEVDATRDVLLAEQEKISGKPTNEPAVDPKFAELEAAYKTADLSTRDGRAIAHKYLDAKIASYDAGESAAS